MVSSGKYDDGHDSETILFVQHRQQLVSFLEDRTIEPACFGVCMSSNNHPIRTRSCLSK